MFDVSLNTANFWFDASNVILLGGALLVAVGTYGVFKAGSIKEHYEDVRISANEKAAAEAYAAGEQGKAEAAEANLKAAELEKQNVELREKIANRRITEKQYKVLIGILRKQPGIINIESMTDPESGLYAADFQKLFQNAGWKIEGTTFPLGQIWIGLILYKSQSPDINTVETALVEAKIPFSLANAAPTQVATIIVGGKPPVF
jgi:hypothetical protein